MRRSVSSNDTYSIGFTIVELLIVIVVIAILASISLVTYNGIQDRARVSVAKSYSSQILRSPDMAEFAIAYYDFEEGSGTVISDRSGKVNDGTATGSGSATTYSTDTPSGIGRSFSFNGSTRITTSIPLQPTYYYKSAWIKPIGCNNIISAGSGSSDAFYLPSCVLNSGHNSSWSSVTDTKTLNDGKWHHVAVEFTQTSTSIGTMKLWRDGSLVATNTNVGTPTNISSTTPIIAAFGSGNMFTGLMDDVVLITR